MEKQVMKAYDILVSDQPDAPDGQGGQGWCFGLPPGIKPEQWPLDPWNGYPLMHGFTLLLPEDYRVHGPDIVALSFFATAHDHNDGGYAQGHPGIKPLIDAPANQPPADSDLLPFWHRARLVHPRTFRMQDILGCSYAVVLLTKAEFEAPACFPPQPVQSPVLQRVAPPLWLAHGAHTVGRYYNGGERLAPDPLGAINVHRRFLWTPRAQDPNAGIPPRDPYGEETAENGYRSPWYWLNGKPEIENWRQQEWAIGHESCHIGGTMEPVQGVPEFSPYYIEFEESFGGYNFGGGNAQLDFRDMKFDWACG